MPKRKRKVKKTRRVYLKTLMLTGKCIGKKRGKPVVFLTTDPLTKRLTFFVVLERKIPSHVSLLEGKIWHRFVCALCGKEKRFALLHQRGNRQRWICITARSWPLEHRCF